MGIQILITFNPANIGFPFIGLLNHQKKSNILNNQDILGDIELLNGRSDIIMAFEGHFSFLFIQIMQK